MISAHRGFKSALVLVIAATVALSVFGSGAAQAQSFAATLTPVAGLIQHLPRDGSEWQNVTRTTLVNQGDQIRTGNDGLARLNVVTGISVDIYPTTWLELNNLSLGEGDNSALTYSLFQLVGRTYVTVDQELNPNDRVQVVYPTVGIVVTGTKFFNFIHPQLDAFAMVEEGEADARSTRLPNVRLTPENALYVRFELPSVVPEVCSLALLDSNVEKIEITEIRPTGEGIDALRRHLEQALTAQVNRLVRPYLRELVGLPPVTLATLTREQDVEEINELLAAIPDFDGNEQELVEFLENYREFWRSYFAVLSGVPIAPETCGNGIQEPGETAINCPTDLADLASCGNNLCEIDRVIQGDLGESVINCPADCLPYPGLALSCAGLITTSIGVPPGVTPVPSGVGFGR
jgi:hypothetical protein